MKRALRLVACALLATVAACGCAAPGHDAPTVSVRGAWGRPSAGLTIASAVYLELASPGGDRLLEASVSAQVARFTQIHETTRTRNSTGTVELGMHRVKVVDLPAGKPVVFEPGGRHIMLLDLTRPLAVGDTVRLALRFAKAPPETVAVPVRDE